MSETTNDLNNKDTESEELVRDTVNNESAEEITASEAAAAESNDDAENLQEENSAGTAEAAKVRTFRGSMKTLSDWFVSFINENNAVARLIGLFMIFSSVVFIKNYHKDPRMRFWELHNGDAWKEYSSSVGIGKMAVFIAVGFAAVSLVKRFVPKLRNFKFDSLILLSGSLLFGICAVWRNDSNPLNAVFSFGIVLVVLVLLHWFLDTDDCTFIRRIPNIAYISILLICAAGVGGYVAWTTICKHRIYHTAVFDLGIFTQMYHSIVTHFTQVTTCERGYDLSHFAVHFSPIYYVLAPVYYLFPSPETLLAAQAFLAVSGFIPLYKICRGRGFSNAVTFLFGIVYIFSVSVMSPCYYEFHENAFLPPLLMWFFYAIEKEKKVLMYVFMVLLLMVKEDAALYVMCIGLYMLFSGKNRKHGAIIFCATAAVFVNVLALMSKYGEGAMTNRTFGNLMRNYDSGFGEVIKTALTNPMYFINQCFLTGDEEKFYEKIVFFTVMLLPLLFMPFITKKRSRLFLVVPFIIMNLASGYPYASKFDYQYVFGTATCLIYAAVINVADLDKKSIKEIVPLMAVASLIMFAANDTNKLYYPEVYKNYKDNNDRKNAFCEAIPEDASLLATPFLIPHCANRDKLYVLDEGSAPNPDTTDFVIFEDGSEEWKQNKRALLESEGYTVYNEAEGLIVIYVSPDYNVNK
ncbi:DUF2079 domain-containing protein [Ruminococcus sp. HUN007]|uniref:DUF2079 domain-containing protein n=1 Tax=Ruminococcus sp. HUN007 TaxID=1514668 RepID=UPI0006798943|nr:DUF2079 domain-containing protein [Ruminococcus sp. HUN007]